MDIMDELKKSGFTPITGSNYDVKQVRLDGDFSIEIKLSKPYYKKIKTKKGARRVRYQHVNNTFVHHYVEDHASIEASEIIYNFTFNH